MYPDEEWRPIDWIPDMPTDKYSISSYGRIRNNYTNHIRKNIERASGSLACLLSTTPKTKKTLIHYTLIYQQTINNPKTVFVTIDQVVAKAFLPPPNDDPNVIAELIHLDTDPKNNHYTNLSWEYHLKNSYIKEQHSKYNTKKNMTETDVRKICEMLIEENGSIRKMKIRIATELPHISIEQVEGIKYKTHFSDISNEYFYFDDRRFEPIKPNEEECGWGS